MIAHPENKALVTVIPEEQHTTFIEPFTARELSALDTVCHAEDITHHNMLLQHASAGYTSFPRDEHELHEAFYLTHHGVLSEVAPGWYGFTALGMARAQVTAHAS